MQSTHATVNMSAATATPGRLPTPVPAAASLAPGQLGPTPAIPTLKQLQDHHIKAKQIGGVASNNNSTTATNNNNYKSGMQPPRTVPPVVLKLDAVEPSTKRTYSVSTAQAEPATPVAAPCDGPAEPAPKKARKHSESSEAPGFSLKVPAGLAASAMTDVGLGVSPVLHTPGVILAVERPPLPGLLPYPPPNPFLVGLPPPPTSPMALLPPSSSPMVHLPPPPRSPISALPLSATTPLGLLPPPRPPSGSTASMPPVSAPSRPPSRPSSNGSTASSSSRSSAAARTNPSQSPRGKRKTGSRQPGPEENREGLLDCVKHVPENFQSVLRQHIMVQLMLSQAHSASSAAVTASLHKAEMISSYQPWVILTYGDAAKTKTITLAKYARIVRTLRGEEVNSAENSKFRFWVRSKGFRLGAPEPDGHARKPADDILGSYGIDTRSGHLYVCADEAGRTVLPVDAPPLYVPTGTNKEDDGRSVPVYKRVAVVENFFDIIYSVHVDIEGRGVKHAGQKRTYRTITDSYAFLPREAVTRFLLGCTECNRHPRSPGSPTPSVTAITKDDDSVSADSLAASSGVSRLHPLPLAPDHTELYKRFADLPRESGGVTNGLLPYTFPADTSRSRYLASSPSSPVSPDLAAASRFAFSPPAPSVSPCLSPSPLSRPAGSVGILSRNGPSAFHSPADHGKQNGQPVTNGHANGHADGQHADDIRTRSPALAEALLLPLREDAAKGESLFKQPLPSVSPVFLHTPAGRKTDVSLTPLTPSEKLASSPFSIENISKSSRSSPTPPEHFAVPEPPRPRSPKSTGPSAYLQPLETVAPRLPVAEPSSSTTGSSSVCVPVPVRAVPSATPSSSIMAGFEPAAGSGLLNLLLKSGVLRNRGPRTVIPEAGEIDLNLPITTTYLKYMRSLGYADEDALQIDVEMSLYQHVLGVPLKVVDDYL
ncbi:uncharacterized protein LOC117646254 [Thrips palmi]|uniref:Uncharacterized protein LOC117646254 n=1 Tax=Thrips palmi TaxID=161013 RepID=A0A6P8Z056_THRPL|nr:uncharacterized protein LOC117646254 [Thrips palmi]